MQKARIFLLPFSWLYGVAIWLRNRFYDYGWLAQHQSNETFTVVVGNLEVGGTGKTPMIEYLVRQALSTGLQVATLSRGYGRSTRGFYWVETNSKPEEVGDEPLQFKTKFPNIGVAVCENRWEGVQKLEKQYDLILLDDAFQHRALRPHFSIVLFDYSSFARPFRLMPAGNYRDHWQERGRADAWVVTKCPSSLSESNREVISRRLRLKASGQYSKTIPLYFTETRYLPAIYGSSGVAMEVQDLQAFDAILLVTGIAKAQPLVDYVFAFETDFKHIEFPDHHQFDEQDYRKIQASFESLPGKNKILITTEKDAQRIQATANVEFLELPWCYIPIHIGFQDSEKEDELWKQIQGQMNRLKK